MNNLLTSVLGLAMTLSVIACTGVVGDPLPSGSAGTAGIGGSGTNPPEPESTCRAEGSLASARISLLSDEEYTNVVRDAFGVTFKPETPPDGTYSLDESATVSSSDSVNKFYRAADQVAEKVKPCGDSPIAATCVESFLRERLPRAWKRPVTEAELAGLMTVFNSGLENGRAMSLVMRAALASASFLYRTEVGADASVASGSVTLTPYELASALSFSTLGSIADNELWAKAADGSIAEPAVLSAEVDRLLALQPVRDVLSKRVRYYLNVEKIPAVNKGSFPEFTATLRSSLYQSAQLFINDLVWNGGTISDLLTSNKYYANEEIAKVYGLPAVQGSALVEVQLPPERNAGILTHPQLLATTNTKGDGSDDIVHRGLWVYRSLVCGQTLGDPPANAFAVQATLMGTDRVKAQARDALPNCGACHAFFDPFGFASQHFDPIGRYRTIDPQDNLPIVSESMIKGQGPEIDGAVSSLKEVADRLKGGRRLSDCAAATLAQYTLKHHPGQENSCALQQLKDDFAKNGNIVGLFRSVLTSPAFRTRDLSSQ